MTTGPEPTRETPFADLPAALVEEPLDEADIERMPETDSADE